MGQEKLGRNNPTLIKAMAAFGGGVASTGNLCGCLSGGVACLSSIYGREVPSNRESVEMWKLSNKLARRFQELTKEFGSLNCRDISQVDWRDRDQVRDFYHNPDSRRQICVRLVGETARALGELLEQAQAQGQ